MFNKKAIQKIIEDKGFTGEEVAKMLFPQNKNPKGAWGRIINNKQIATERQKSKLALLLDIDVKDLYTKEPIIWSGTPLNSHHILVLNANEYWAEINTLNWHTKISSKNTLIHKTIQLGGDIKLSDYICEINRIINQEF